VNVLTKLVCQQGFALDGVPTLGHLTAAVTQVETNLPGDAVVQVPHFQEGAVSNGSLFLQNTEKINI
jgi:hypothetical protein